MDTKTAHIPEPPFYAFVIRIVQLVFAFIIVGLAGHTIDGCDSITNLNSSCAFNPLYDDLAPASFVVFCSVWTFVIVGYLIVTTLWFPIAYNIWAQLFFEITGCIFWLAGFSALAAKVNDPDYKVVKERVKWKTSAAASGLGALMWLLFIATLVTFIIQLRKHLNDPANKNLSRLGVSAAEKGVNTEMGAIGVQQPEQYLAQPTPGPYSAQPTPAPADQYPQPVISPVSYVQPTPPPQQWQQSPPPVQHQQ